MTRQPPLPGLEPDVVEPDAAQRGRWEAAHVASLLAKYTWRCEQPDASDDDRRFLARLTGRAAELAGVDRAECLRLATERYPDLEFELTDEGLRVGDPRRRVAVLRFIDAAPTEVVESAARLLQKARPMEVSQ